MREIIVRNNQLDEYQDSDLVCDEGKIIFKKNGEYLLEYRDSDKIELEIEVLDDVMVKLFIYSEGCGKEIRNHYVLGKNSNMILFQFYYNEGVKERSIIDLNGEFSQFSQGFSSISRGNEEYHIVVNHNHHHVESHIHNKCIGLDGSKVWLEIDSNLKQGNTDCVMDQNSRILTLGDVDAKVIPNMFIDENSVEAKHGSVIGGFREEEIFYLMSRGICEREAISLLMKGFIFSNLVVDMKNRARIYEIIQDLRR